MNEIVIRGFEAVLVAFLVSGLATTIYNIVTFRERSDRIARCERLRRVA